MAWQDVHSHVHVHMMVYVCWRGDPYSVCNPAKLKALYSFSHLEFFGIGKSRGLLIAEMSAMAVLGTWAHPW